MPFEGGLSGLEAAAYLHAAGFSGNDLQTAVAIAKAESGLKPNAKGGPNSNGTFDWGLMQINDVHKPSAAVKVEPLANAKAAFGIYTRAGKTFKPWATFGNGAYKAHATFAKESVTALKNAGPPYERALLAGKNPGTDTPLTFPGVKADTGIPGLGALGALDSVPSAIAGAANAVSSQFAKIGGNIATVAIALAFIILGVVLLARGAATGVAKSVVKDVIK